MTPRSGFWHPQDLVEFIMREDASGPDVVTQAVTDVMPRTGTPFDESLGLEIIRAAAEADAARDDTLLAAKLLVAMTHLDQPTIEEMQRASHEVLERYRKPYRLVLRLLDREPREPLHLDHLILLMTSLSIGINVQSRLRPEAADTIKIHDDGPEWNLVAVAAAAMLPAVTRPVSDATTFYEKVRNALGADCQVSVPVFHSGSGSRVTRRGPGVSGSGRR